MSATERLLRGFLLGAASIFVLVGLSLLPFLNPVWISFEQGRAEATAWTGWSEPQVRLATDALLHDLVIGPPAFDVEIDGTPVFNERERSHMRDVRTVFSAFFALAVLGLVVLLVGRRRTGGGAAFWRPVGRAALLAAGVIVALGVVFGVAFDAAFELFHRVFFPAGSYDFDPATERLVQLLPGRLWFETSLAFGAVLFLLATGTAALALRRSSGRPTGDR